MAANGQRVAKDGIAAFVVAHVEEALADYEADRDALLERVVRLGTNRLDEESRRQLEGLTLKSTYNRHRVRTLAALVEKLREELQPLLVTVATKRILLDFAEREIEAFEAAEQRNVQDRQVKKETGLYVEPAAFADRMFRDYDIDRGAFAALGNDDLQAIAEIMRARVAKVNS